MGLLVTSANADSIGGRFHPYTGPLSLSPSTYDMPYPKSHSLSDLGNYGRVDFIQRESIYGNGFVDEYGMPYSMHSSAPSTMAEYYGSLGGRTWNSVPAAAMAPDFDRSQNTILYSKTPNRFSCARAFVKSTD